MQVLNDDSHKILGVAQMILKKSWAGLREKVLEITGHDHSEWKVGMVYSLKDAASPLIDAPDKMYSSSNGLTSQAVMCHPTGFGVQL